MSGAGAELSGDASMNVSQATYVINHLHGGLNFSRRAAPAGDDQLPTVYMLDVKALLRITAEAGMTVIPRADGEPRAFVFAASRPMREWVEAQLSGGRALWLPAKAAKQAPEVEGARSTADDQ